MSRKRVSEINDTEISDILQKAADDVFNAIVKHGEYFRDLNFSVSIYTDQGGFVKTISINTGDWYKTEEDIKLSSEKNHK